MQLDILTPDASIFSGEVESSTLPGSTGSFQVLKNHAPLVSILDAGLVKYVNASGQEESLSITGGMVEVNNNKVIVLADGVTE